jgi:septum formation inhibitor-activating ATPase MinD
VVDKYNEIFLTDDTPQPVLGSESNIVIDLISLIERTVTAVINTFKEKHMKSLNVTSISSSKSSTVTKQYKQL